MVACHLAVVARVDDPRVVPQPLALERIDHRADGVVDDRDVGGVRAAHATNGVVGHGRGIGDPEERVEKGAVATRALEGGAPGRAWHGDVDVAVAPHGLLRRIPGVVRPREADEEKERLGAVVAFDPLHGLLAVPGVDVGLERDGHRRRVPHRHALGGVLPVLVLTLVAAVSDVLLVGIEELTRRRDSRCSESGSCRRTCRPSRRPPRSPAPRAGPAMSSMWDTVSFSSR